MNFCCGSSSSDVDENAIILPSIFDKPVEYFPVDPENQQHFDLNMISRNSFVTANAEFLTGGGKHRIRLCFFDMEEEDDCLMKLSVNEQFIFQVKTKANFRGCKRLRIDGLEGVVVDFLWDLNQIDPKFMFLTKMCDGQGRLPQVSVLKFWEEEEVIHLIMITGHSNQDMLERRLKHWTCIEPDEDSS